MIRAVVHQQREEEREEGGEGEAAGRVRQRGRSKVDEREGGGGMSVGGVECVKKGGNAAEGGAEGMVECTAAGGSAFIPYGPLGADRMEAGAKLNPQDALAWLLKRSPNIVVIPGTTKAAHVAENFSTWAAL